MQTIDTGATGSIPVARSKIDPAFAKLLVVVNGGVPALLLAWDALRHNLGVNAVNYAIRTTGIIGLLLLVLSLAVTPLRRLTGWSELIASRRALGLYGFFYLFAHFAIFFFFDRAASVSSTLHEIVARRYLQIGTAGLLLMLPLAITSTDAMVARLGARRWKRLHRLAYPSAIAGALHYFLLVKADVRQPLAIAGALAVLLSFRVVVYGIDRQRKIVVRSSAAKRSAEAASSPKIAGPRKPRFWTGTLKVASVFQETADVRTFRLTTLDGQPLPFSHEPGQYLNVVLSIGGSRVRRSYTISSPSTRSAYCEITIKRKGDGYASCHIHDELRAGSTLEVSAPAGRFVFDGTGAKAILLLAGGVGVTPLMAIVRHLTDTSWAGRIYLVVSARRERDIIYREEIDYLAKRFPNLRVLVTLTEEEGPAWTGARGRISEALLESLVPELKDVPIYVCGPDRMMDAMRRMLIAMQVPPTSISSEAFVSPVRPVDEPDETTSETTTEPAPPSRSVRLYRLGLAKRDLTIEMTRDQTILEAVEEAGYDLPFECRSGVCGQCKVRLLRGRVTMDADGALSSAEKSRGIILACQAHPEENVAVDA